ncbi:MAG: LTA synthase family protein, partial [Synergistes sp.]|nr:LTA synthase family protein [Synergistes sp.]
LQYFVTDLEIDGVPVTPNLNRFKNECVYFPNTWSQVAAGNSSDAEFMANTGLFPAAYGAAYTRYADNYYNSLARAMRKKYNARTFVVQGTKSSFWNCHRMHPTLGFHRQYSQNTYPEEEVIGLGLSDGVIFSKAAEIIEAAGTPFYAFIVTLSCHHPYDFEGIPKDDLILPPEMEGTLTGNYLRSVNYFDREFGAFIEKLRAKGVLDKSLVVVYGDHPAIPIAAKEEMEKLFGLDLENNTNWKKTRRIPLLFRTPESAKHPRTDYRNVGQMDILPTVSGLMRLGIDTAFGADLFAGSKDDLVIFRNGSYISGDVLVDPASNRVVDIKDGEQVDAAAYDADTAEAEKRLRYNDLILENNLLKKIMPKQ